jgi:virulence factor Mce-like protein
MRGRGGAAVVASPVLIGAVTVLIAIVAVFLAYNANQGLPFVPTYDINMELPGGANLVKGNEVRVGGFRVGLIDEINPKVEEDPLTGQRRSIAQVHVKLDKKIEPIATDSSVIVRPRSALGLKYIELDPGEGKNMVAPGGTLQLEQAEDPVEFDDLLNTFDEDTRQNSQLALEGFGSALAGRGQSLNEAIANFRPFFVYLEPVMRNLADPETRLDEFFKQIGRASAQAAPVARVQAELFENMAITFEAFSRNPDALRATIEKNPVTQDVAIRSFRVQQPFLANFADLSRRLQPAARELPRSLPKLNRAFVVGQDVLPDTVSLNERTRDVFIALEDLFESPDTLLGLRDLRDLVSVGRPLLEYIAPFQTVCNYWNYWWDGLGGHISYSTQGGFGEGVMLKSDTPTQQPNKLNQSTSHRPVDIPANKDPQSEEDAVQKPSGAHLEALHGQVYSPAIDAQGNADCQSGQTGYLDGPLIPGQGAYPPADAEPGDSVNNGYSNFQNNSAGGSHVVVADDTPGLAGPTFSGVRNLRDVP